ncbi:mynd finger domain-containing protein [Ophiostoma piceae UAMH 11346]|uniref:Mynd finger domain-containing protein n=1 Tax=Ophiostoma piceae (strain UAMH 11346) TaxID=1262450 RepID=S3CQM0_OPHP1|nr:mynd finger domain-containing protein [Ophiostoma piceae UAMH 11346]
MTAAPPGLEIRGEKSPQGISPATRGRGLFSTKSFEPGEQIALFDKPLFALPSSHDIGTQCNNCLDARRQPTKLCTGCRAVAYCSPACQRAHWSRYHKFECKPLCRALESAALNLISNHAAEVVRADSTSVIPDAAIDTLEIPTPVRALILAMMRYEKDTSGNGIRKQIEQLESNTVAFVRNQNLWNDFKLQAAAACKFTDLQTEEKIKMAIEVMCRIHTNSFDRSDVDTATSGLYLDTTLAMVNHSCMPNAVVAFVGQKAYLRAQAPVAAGDELTISYIDYTKPLAARQEGLVLYNFACSCQRCAEDLDIYQVCKVLATSPKTKPMVELNDSFTLVPDVEILRNPPVLSPSAAPGLTPKQVQAIYDKCDIEKNADPENRLGFMRKLWTACQPLIKADRWAMEPLAALVRHTTLYFTEIGNYSHALALACYSAQHIDPYKYPAPFAQWRVKGLLVVAKLLPHIMPVVHPAFAFDGGKAHNEAKGEGRGADPLKKVHPAVLKALPDLADGGIYEALMLMALAQGPKGHSEEWPPLESAQLMLNDVRQSSPEHERITKALAQWFANPTEPSMKAFFDMQFMNAINTLSSHAIEILTDLLK